MTVQIAYARRPLARRNTHAGLTALGPDEFEGYASLFGVSDGVGDTVVPGAFAASLRRRGPAEVRMLYQTLNCLRLSPCSPPTSPSPAITQTS